MGGLVVAKIGRCLYANGLPFKLVNSPHLIEMIEEIGGFGMGLKQPSIYELRTRVLSGGAINDVIKATHVKAWDNLGTL